MAHGDLVLSNISALSELADTGLLSARLGRLREVDEAMAAHEPSARQRPIAGG